MENVRIIGGPWDGRVVEVEDGLTELKVFADKKHSAEIPDRNSVPSPRFPEFRYVKRRLAGTGEAVFILDDSEPPTGR